MENNARYFFVEGSLMRYFFAILTRDFILNAGGIFLKKMWALRPMFFSPALRWCGKYFCWGAKAFISQGMEFIFHSKSCWVGAPVIGRKFLSLQIFSKIYLSIRTLFNSMRLFLLMMFAFSVFSYGGEITKLAPPNMERGDCVMKAFAKRSSTKSFSQRAPSMQDVSDLLFAANGINRPESGKRTAPSALNRQDIKIYVCMPDAAYLYLPKEHALELIAKVDLRQSEAPICLVLVSDFNDRWSGLDAGIVSQNISIFCAGVGLGTYPHTTMDVEGLRAGLKLKGTQTPMICNSVGFPK